MRFEQRGPFWIGHAANVSRVATRSRVLERVPGLPVPSVRGMGSSRRTPDGRPPQRMLGRMRATSQRAGTDMRRLD